MNNTRIARVLLSSLLLCLAIPGQAEDSAWNLRGFGTLGVAYNDSDGATFVRDFSQPRGAREGVSARPDTMLGLQLQYRHNEQLDAMVQVVSRYSYYDDFRPLLNWAYVRYTPTPSWTLRLGRMNVDVLMLADARQVGYAHPWVRPPIEYFDLQSFNLIDGADIEYRQRLGPGLAWAKLYAGRADERVPVPHGGDLDLSGSTTIGGHVNYQLGSWWLRLGASTSRFAREFEQLEPLIEAQEAMNGPLAGELGYEDKGAHTYTLGLQYERGAFQAQIMGARVDPDTLSIPEATTGYLMGSYRMGDWRPYAFFSAVTSSPVRRASGFPQGSPADEAVQELLSFSQRKQHTLGLGARFDFHPNAALKLQVERIRADKPHVSMTQQPDPDWNGRATVASVALDFIF